VARLISHSKATGTLRRYERALRDFSLQKSSLTALEEWLARRASHKGRTIATEIGSLRFMLARVAPTKLATIDPLLQDLARGARLMGAAEPLAKALPMTPDDVATLIRTAPTPQIKAACFMAWATASRFGEIRPLTGKNFRRVGREQLLCVWTTTKGNPEGKPRIDHYCDFRAPAWFRKHLREHPNNPFKCGRRLRT
jgi:hypothetical protein